MIGWCLTPRVVPDRPVDGSPIRVDALRESPEAVLLPTAIGSIKLGDLFRVDVVDRGANEPAIVINGDCRWLDRIGAARPGQIHSGDVDFIHVRGSVGAMIGHRMRRGTVWVDGDVGDWAGAMMIAGTLVVAGCVGRGAMTDAKRGSLICGVEPTVASERFPVEVDLAYPTAKVLADACCGQAAVDWLESLATLATIRRGDVSLGGQAEVVYPVSR